MYSVTHDDLSDTMRVLLIADAGDGLLDPALRAQALGHQVRLFIRKFDAKTRPVGKGLVERVDDWRAWMHWADLVVLEANGVYLADMEVWRRRGVPIIGGNPESASWELERTKGMEKFKQAGIAVPPYREFRDYVDAIKFVERRGEVFFSKPCSDTADKSLSAKTGIPEDPTFMLRRWKRKHGHPSCPFILQEPIDGIEMGVAAWFGPGGFASGWEENWEHKRFCAGDVGPNTGEMGTPLRYVRRSKLADKVLAPFEDELAGIGYVGNVSVNCIISEGDIWPLEWTMRLGWPSFDIELDLFEADFIEFFGGLAVGEPPRGAHKLDQIAVGVCAVLPPYPHPPRDYDDIVGVPIYGIDDDPHWHSCEVMAGIDAPLASAGHYLGVAVGTGATVRQAARGAYKTLDRLSMPASPFWRNDIGGRLKKDLPALQAHGFAAGMEF